jgi:hypothetical protein
VLLADPGGYPFENGTIPYEDTYYNFLPGTFYGSVYFGMGTDNEYEPVLKVSRAHSRFHVGEWYLAHPGGMNITDNYGRLRVPTVAIETEADRTRLAKVIYLIEFLFSLMCGPNGLPWCSNSYWLKVPIYRPRQHHY